MLKNIEIAKESNSEEEGYDDYSINTNNAYHLLKKNQDDISHHLLVEFRDELENILPRKAQPSAKFHPLHWKYHKEKYLMWQRDNHWREDGSNVFSPYYFMSDARISGEITYSTLSEDEKRTVDESAKKLGEEKWSRWGYDAYSLWDNCPLSYEKDEEDFEFFFSWQLRLTDLLKIRAFLQWHIKNTFKSNLMEFKDFIEILYIKYDKILICEKNKKVVFSVLEKIEEKIKEPLSQDNNTITIGLPNFPRTNSRRKNDELTYLSRERTALLIDILREVNVFLKEDFQSNVNVAKAIQVLTGYTHNKLRTDLTAIPANEDLVATKEILQKSINLIDNQLKKRKG